MPETRYVICMTTAKGEFYWTGSVTQDDVYGQFRTFGWSEFLDKAKLYQLRHMAVRTAQRLHGDYSRLFPVESTAVVECVYHPGPARLVYLADAEQGGQVLDVDEMNADAYEHFMLGGGANADGTLCF